MGFNEPVDIRRQMIYAVIPFLSLYAALRVERFRMMLVVYAVHLALLIPFWIVGFDECDDDWFLWYGLILEVIALAVTVNLIYGWSEDWNESYAE